MPKGTKKEKKLLQLARYEESNVRIPNDDSIGVIDFNRWEVGDPYEEFYKLQSFGTEHSIPYCIGQIDAYFDDNIPVVLRIQKSLPEFAENGIMDIKIKNMESEEEIKGKAYVHWKAWHEAYAGLVSREFLEAWTLEKCEKIAHKWPDNILIAKEGENVVGFSAYGRHHDDELYDIGEIFAIYVLAEYYGKGVGMALMQAALKILDVPQIAVWVLDGNNRAISFYKKCGFSFDGCKKEIMLGLPATELRMLLKR